MFLELGIVVFGRRGFLEDKNGMSRCIMSMTSVIDKDDDDGFCPQPTQRERDGFPLIR